MSSDLVIQTLKSGPAVRKWFLHLDPKIIPPELYNPDPAAWGDDTTQGLTSNYPPLWCTDCETMPRAQSPGSKVWTCDCGLEGNQETLEEIVRGHLDAIRQFLVMFCPRPEAPARPPWWKRWFSWGR